MKKDYLKPEESTLTILVEVLFDIEKVKDDKIGTND